MARGRCTLRAGSCQLLSDADCALSNRCKLKGKCTHHKGRCIIGRNLDRRTLAPKPGGLVAGLGFAGTSIGGSPDPNLYAGLGAHVGWAFDFATLYVGLELYPRSSFVHSATATALNSSLAEQQVQVEQPTNTALTRFGAWANYYLIGGHRQPFSLVGVGGLAGMVYSLNFTEVDSPAGYGDVPFEPMNLFVMQLDTGLAVEAKAGPVHAFVDARVGVPLFGGASTTIDLSTPLTLTLQLGARIAL